MSKITRATAASAMALVLLAAAPRPAENKAAGLTLDVILEEVDLAGNTLTARPCSHVVPPSGATGGVVYAGHLPPGAKAARYERLPVMPEAGLQGKGLRPGMRVTLRFGRIDGGALVVVSADESSDYERVGVHFIDVSGPPRDR